MLLCNVLFQNESTLYSCLNVKERLARNRCYIWILSDNNEVRTHKHLVCKRMLNHLAKLVKWLGCVVSTYLYGAFDSMLLSYHEFHCCHLHLSIISLEFYSTLQQWFLSTGLVILRLWYIFCSRSLQIPKLSGLKTGLFSGQWWGSRNRSCFLSFNISRVSLAVWVLALFCRSKYSLCSASLLISGIIFFKNWFLFIWDHHIASY